MGKNEFAELLPESRIMFLDKEVDAAGLEWNPHPQFRGVYLKHLVRGMDTGGQLSCHLVRVDAGCELARHQHGEQWELHEVVSGTGDAMVSDRECPYSPGCMSVIPLGVSHQVVAGDSGLLLLAKFFPALL